MNLIHSAGDILLVPYQENVMNGNLAKEYKLEASKEANRKCGRDSNQSPCESRSGWRQIYKPCYKGREDWPFHAGSTCVCLGECTWGGVSMSTCVWVLFRVSGMLVYMRHSASKHGEGRMRACWNPGDYGLQSRWSNEGRKCSNPIRLLCLDQTDCKWAVSELLGSVPDRVATGAYGQVRGCTA